MLLTLALIQLIWLIWPCDSGYMDDWVTTHFTQIFLRILHNTVKGVFNFVGTKFCPSRIFRIPFNAKLNSQQGLIFDNHHGMILAMILYTLILASLEKKWVPNLHKTKILLAKLSHFTVIASQKCYPEYKVKLKSMHQQSVIYWHITSSK